MSSTTYEYFNFTFLDESLLNYSQYQRYNKKKSEIYNFLYVDYIIINT